MKYFVFVVCGPDAFITQLNNSLKFLCHFSDYPVLVATDMKRNESAIEHDQIIDIPTPKEYSHREASIYLETSLHKHLKLKDNIYCYLDSDIVAINNSINQVFDHFQYPASFARDHAGIDFHSPHAMKCDCLTSFAGQKELFSRLGAELPAVSDSPKAMEDREMLNAVFEDMRSYPLKSFFKNTHYFIQRYLLPVKSFKFSYLTFDKKKRCWYNDNNDCIHYDFNYYSRKLRKKYKVHFEAGKGWLAENGKSLKPETPHCVHAREYIKSLYDVRIAEDFKHWNGGVFLFNETSVPFMDRWHEITVKEIEQAEIHSKYIDQISLLLSMLEFAGDDLNYLPMEFNFITDRGYSSTSYKEGKGYTYNNFRSLIAPSFLHVYHHWGDKKWSIWQSVEKLGEEIGIELEF